MTVHLEITLYSENLDERNNIYNLFMLRSDMISDGRMFVQICRSNSRTEASTDDIKESYLILS